METIKPNIEKGDLRVEHTKNFDFLINEDSGISPVDSAKLVRALKDGVPEDWSDYEDRFSSPDGRYFIKRKWTSKKKKYFKDARSGGSVTWIEMVSEEKALVNYAALSITSELSNSKKVRTIVAGQNVQNLVRQYGVDKIEFVEPLMGMIDKKNGRRYMVYPYIDAEEAGRFVELQGREEELGNNLESIIDGLVEIFIKNNLRPNDLRSQQLLISENPADHKLSLFLLDTEFYNKIPKSAK